MTHFKELVETVIMTTGISKRQLAIRLRVTTETLRYWEVHNGPTKRRIPRVMNTLKQLILQPKDRSVDSYNGLIKRGYNDFQIAAHWNMHPRNFYTWKIENGLAIYKERSTKPTTIKPFVAKIKVGNKEMFLGKFKTAEEAKRAEEAAAETLAV